MFLKQDIDFIQLVSVICADHGCVVESIDGRTISINCPDGKAQEERCAQAIADVAARDDNCAYALTEQGVLHGETS